MWTSVPSATFLVTTMLFVITLSGHITVRVTLNTLETAPHAQVNSCLIHHLKKYIFLLSSQCPCSVAPNSTVCPSNFYLCLRLSVCLSVYSALRYGLSTFLSLCNNLKLYLKRPTLQNSAW